MRVGRHQSLTRARCLIGQRFDETGGVLLKARNSPSQIEAQIERHLLVARSTGVEAAAQIAESFDELPLDEAVNVLVRTSDERGF